MKILKSKINNSSYKLYHNNQKLWTEQFSQNLKVGETYRFVDGKDYLLKSIDIRRSIKLTSFLFFWFKVEPSFTIGVIVEEVNSKLTSFIDQEQFINNLKMTESFNLTLNRIVSKNKT